MNVLRDIVISIGIFLGLLEPGNLPEINSRIFKDHTALFCSVEVVNCVNREMEQLITAGNRLTLTLEISAGEKRIPSVWHSISYEPESGLYFISNSITGETHKTQSEAAAYIIFYSFYNIRILDISEYEALSGKAIHITAIIGMEAAAGFDPEVLWDYRRPENKHNYSSVKEIPY